MGGVCFRDLRRGLTGRVGSLRAVSHACAVGSTSVLDNVVRPTCVPGQSNKDRSAVVEAAEREKRVARRKTGERGRKEEARTGGEVSSGYPGDAIDRSTSRQAATGSRTRQCPMVISPHGSLTSVRTLRGLLDAPATEGAQERGHELNRGGTHALPSSYPGWFSVARISFLTASYDPGADMVIMVGSQVVLGDGGCWQTSQRGQG